MIPSLTRRLVAEALGTCLLAATVIGTGLMGALVTGDIGLQLLANALATAAMLAVLIALLGPISGAHLNPAVSLVMCLTGTLAWRDLALYVLVQIGGGVAGAGLAHVMFAEPLVQVSTQARSGIALGVSEIVASFGLLAVILLGSKRATLPVLVAAYIGAAYWFTASTSFANPAVTIARMLTDSFAGTRPIDGIVFIGAQMVGAVLAWLSIGWLARTNTER